MRYTHHRVRAALARTSIVAVLIGAVGVGAGCNQSAGSGGGLNTPGGHGAPDGPNPSGVQEGESAPELRARIGRLSRDQGKRVSAAMADKAACHDVCSLTAQICGASEKLCEIADRHPQDNDYQSLCREAQLECREATEHCESCVDGHAGDDGLSTQPPPPAD